MAGSARTAEDTDRSDFDRLGASGAASDAEGPLNHDEATLAVRPPRGAPEPGSIETGLGSFPRAQLVVLAVDVVLAVFFAIVLSKPFLLCLAYTMAIGLSMFWLNWALHRLQGKTLLSWKTSAAAIPVGGAGGFAVARFWELGGIGRSFLDRSALGPPLAGALLFGAIMAYYFHARAVVAEGRARLRDEVLQRLENEQRLTEAELKLLQAQIEPHFLFNTLSNILQLIDADPPSAKRMLVNLTSYLRASLHRTRAGPTTVGEELSLVRAYLEIQGARMGARLSYRIDCPSELSGLPLPPLLLQPLVENAVRHGLEAVPGGGEVLVRAERQGGALVFQVQDTGAGLAPGSPSGIGLANVRARVRAVSQGRGSMVIHPNAPQGLSVRITLPLSPCPGEASTGAAVAGSLP